MVDVAMHRSPPDLAITNGTLVNVYTNELWEDCTILVKGNRIAYVGMDDDDKHLHSSKVVDLEGKIIAPGFIDGHCHIESTLVRPVEYARAVLPLGTTTIFADPHEIANVLGVDGVRMMIKDAGMTPLKIFFGVPSCVPASSPLLETSGSRLEISEIEELMRQEQVAFLGEMMNYSGVITGDERLLGEVALALKCGKVADGHIPNQGMRS